MPTGIQFMYDVLAVNIDSGTVRIIDTNKTLPDAEAVVNMAVARRGLETEFFVEVPAGSHKPGDKFKR